MNAAKQLRKDAKKLGWSLDREKGKHQIWVSSSGYKTPLPSTPKGGRSINNMTAKLRRYT